MGGTGRECFHCKQWVEEGEAHDCWTTTEAALTKGLSEDLRDAWMRLRDTAADFGEQRIYASHNSIMFSRGPATSSCGRRRAFSRCACSCRGPSRRRRCAEPSRVPKVKFANLIQIRHRDEVEAPVTDWLEEAYDFAGGQTVNAAPKKKAVARKKAKKRS